MTLDPTPPRSPRAGAGGGPPGGSRPPGGAPPDVHASATGRGSREKPVLLALSPAELQRKALRAFRQGNKARLNLVQLLLALDESRGYLELGYSTITGWAKDHLGWRRSTTLDALRVARALPGLPRLRGACAAGQLSWSALSEISRVATPASEEEWLRFARGKDVGAVRDAVRRALHEGKDTPPKGGWGLPNLDRRIVLKFSASEHEKVRRAFERLARELAERSGGPVGLEEVLLYLAELELARPAEERVPDGAPAARYAVVYLECPTCGAAAMQTGQGPLEVDRREVARVKGEADVATVPPAGARRDTGAAPPSGRPDRRQGSPRAIRKKVLLRDGELCANPHCESRAEHVHHVVPRAAGGADVPENEVSLCARCHAMVHAGVLVLEVARDGNLLFRPRGRALADDLFRLERRKEKEKDAPTLVVVRTSGRGCPPRDVPRAPVEDVRTSGQVLVHHRGAVFTEEDIAEGLARKLKFPRKKALGRVRWALETLGPAARHDLSAVIRLAVRGPAPPGD